MKVKVLLTTDKYYLAIPVEHSENSLSSDYGFIIDKETLFYQSGVQIKPKEIMDTQNVVHPATGRETNDEELDFWFRPGNYPLDKEDIVTL